MLSNGMWDELPQKFVYNVEYDVNTCSIDIKDIQPTQATVHMSFIRKYIRNPSAVDSDGNLPFAIKFKDTRYLLLNGTHRYAVAWWHNHSTMSICVESIPLTLQQACGIIEDIEDDEIIDIAQQVILEALEILKGEAVYA